MPQSMKEKFHRLRSVKKALILASKTIGGDGGNAGHGREVSD